MTAPLNQLHPDLQPLCHKWLDNCHAAGLRVSVTFTWRSVDEQNIIYAQGRTAPGPIRTNAKGGQSAHNFTLDDGTPASKAFDWACFDHNAAYITDGKDPSYKQAGEIGEALGLHWGGRWKHSDYCHLQLDPAC